jgi:aspartate ammonia-lyase
MPSSRANIAISSWSIGSKVAPALPPNMNANEVFANIALEMTGHKKGEYNIIEPHDDLNMSQSTNDSYPTAIKVAFILRNEKLVAELTKLSKRFGRKVTRTSTS